MGDQTRPDIDRRSPSAGSDGHSPSAGTWPRGTLTLGLWLFCFTLVAVLRCLFVNEFMLSFLAGFLAVMTITMGLITAIGGAIGGPRRRVQPQPIDHRALRGGLLLVLGGFVLGFAVFFIAVFAVKTALVRYSN